MMNENSRDPLGRAAQSSPELAKAMAKLSPQDMARLREIISDPEKTRQILSTPAAQQLLNRLNGAAGKDKP